LLAMAFLSCLCSSSQHLQIQASVANLLALGVVQPHSCTWLLHFPKGLQCMEFAPLCLVHLHPRRHQGNHLWM